MSETANDPTAISQNTVDSNVPTPITSGATTPVVSKTTSILSKFSFASIGHYFASGITALKSGAKYLESKALPAIQKVDEAVEAPTATLAAVGVPYASDALAIERFIDSAAGELIAAIHLTDSLDPTSATVDIKIGRSTFDAVKEFLETQSAALAALGYKI